MVDDVVRVVGAGVDCMLLIDPVVEQMNG